MANPTIISPTTLALLTQNCSKDLAETYKEHFIRVIEAKELPVVVQLGDIKHSMPYERGTKLYRESAHIGQRKLFMNEVWFLATKIGPRAATVFYAGAAPNNKGGLLSDLFPNIKFVMIDPVPFHIFNHIPHRINVKDGVSVDAQMQEIAESKKRICIMNTYMTIELADGIAKHFPENYFISDIRTNSKAPNARRAAVNDEDAPTNLDIVWNLAQQYNWVRACKPISAMLKFRHPFYSDKIEAKAAAAEPYAGDFKAAMDSDVKFVQNYNDRSLLYLRGEIYIQPWAGETSTETRLICDAADMFDLVDYPVDDYENRLFYYNAIQRWAGMHENDNVDRRVGLDHCADCALENYIWKEYRKSMNTEAPVVDLAAALSGVTKRQLRDPAAHKHGTRFEPVTDANLRVKLARHAKSTFRARR